MSTNIINITNTLTNIINMPPEVTNTVLRVAEMPSKAWWEITLMIGGPALTALSALFMWRSVEEMKRQNENHWIEIIVSYSRMYREACENGCGPLSQPKTTKDQKGEELYKNLSKRANVLYEGCALYYNNFKSTSILKDTWNLLMQKNIKQFIRERRYLKDTFSEQWKHVQRSMRMDPIPLEDTGLGNYCKEYNIDTENTP